MDGYDPPTKVFGDVAFNHICGTLLVADCGTCGIDIWTKDSCVIGVRKSNDGLSHD